VKGSANLQDLQVIQVTASYSHLAVSRHPASPPLFQEGDFKNKVAL